MKRFHFSLQALYQVKMTKKDKAQADYAAARAAMDQAIVKKAQILDQLDQGGRNHRKKMMSGITLPELQAYANYFDDLRKSAEEAEGDIVKRRKIADRRQAELVEFYRELKLLEGLREKQYQAYLKEENAKEAKELENLLAFNAANGMDTEYLNK